MRIRCQFALLLCAATAAVTATAPAFAQGRPSARFCAGEAGAGRYPPGCPRPRQPEVDRGHSGQRQSGGSRTGRRPPRPAAPAYSYPSPPPPRPPGTHLSGAETAAFLVDHTLCLNFRQSDSTCTHLHQADYVGGPNSGQLISYVQDFSAVPSDLGPFYQRNLGLPFVPRSEVATTAYTYSIEADFICVRRVEYGAVVSMLGAQGERQQLAGQPLTWWRSFYRPDTVFTNRCHRLRRPAPGETDVVTEWSSYFGPTTYRSFPKQANWLLLRGS